MSSKPPQLWDHEVWRSCYTSRNIPWQETTPLTRQTNPSLGRSHKGVTVLFWNNPQSILLLAQQSLDDVGEELTHMRTELHKLMEVIQVKDQEIEELEQQLKDAQQQATTRYTMENPIKVLWPFWSQLHFHIWKASVNCLIILLSSWCLGTSFILHSDIIESKDRFSSIRGAKFHCRGQMWQRGPQGSASGQHRVHYCVHFNAPIQSPRHILEWEESEMGSNLYWSFVNEKVVTKSFIHCVPLLHSCHWLPVQFRVDFKIWLLTYKILQETNLFIFTPRVPYHSHPFY